MRPRLILLSWLIIAGSLSLHTCLLQLDSAYDPANTRLARSACIGGPFEGCWLCSLRKWDSITTPFGDLKLMYMTAARDAAGTMSKKEIEENYAISRRIEAEERALETATMVLTSTQQEIDEQWGLYDGCGPGCSFCMYGCICQSPAC